MAERKESIPDQLADIRRTLDAIVKHLEIEVPAAPAEEKQIPVKRRTAVLR